MDEKAPHRRTLTIRDPMENELTEENETFQLPPDIIKMLEKMSQELKESPRDVLIAGIEHFFKIPEQQRKAAMAGAARRRRG